MEIPMSLPTYADDEIDLPAMASWPASKHRFDDRQRNALRAAEAAGRPLLVRGDPGTGKSQLAHAAAVASRRLFLPHVVDARSEASDLLWRFDAVARLADAQLSSHPSGGNGGGVAEAISAHDRLPADRYVHPGPLWWAFDFVGALQHLAAARVRSVPPESPQTYAWQASAGTVLLIDEIDKAESDVPNGLLEALGNGRFSVAMLGLTVKMADGAPPPLVIITTNDERELPPAFVRRCLVLTLSLPAGDALISFLLDRAKLHFPDFAAQHEAVLQDAAQMLAEDRRDAAAAGVYQPGLAEFLDLVRALNRLGGDPGERLTALRDFTYRKQPRT
jgi:MoxR-like ATPase